MGLLCNYKPLLPFFEFFPMQQYLFLIALAEKGCEPEMHHGLQEYYFRKFCLNKNKVYFCSTGKSLDQLPSLTKRTACVFVQSLFNHLENATAVSSAIPPVGVNMGFCKAVEDRGLCTCIIIESWNGLH